MECSLFGAEFNATPSLFPLITSRLLMADAATRPLIFIAFF